MHLNDLIFYVILRYLGDFVEGISKDQLNPGILGGSIELNNVQVRTDALNRLELPIYVTRGTRPFIRDGLVGNLSQ